MSLDMQAGSWEKTNITARVTRILGANNGHTVQEKVEKRCVQAVYSVTILCCGIHLPLLPT